MPITLTQAERIAISRRMIKIPLEVSAYDDAVTSMDTNASIYEDVDDGNREFFNHWNTLFHSYNTELTLLGVPASDELAETNFNNGTTIEFAGNYFYPITTAPGDGTTINSWLIPLITPNLAGITYDWRGKTIALSDAGEKQITDDLYAICQICINGINSGTANTTCSVAYSGGTTLNLTSAAGITVGKYLLINDVAPSVAGYLVRVESIATAPALTVRVVCGSGTCRVAPNGAVVVNQATFWSDANRKNLTTAATYAAAANVIYTFMTTAVTGYITGGRWDLKLAAESAALTTNYDSRSQQAIDNAAAIVNNLTPPTATATWTALPNTDAGGNSKFNNAGLTAFAAAVTARQAIMATRLTQIAAAAGTLVDNGDGTYSGTDGYVYNRYAWLDARINRQYGSLRRYYNQLKSRGYMQNFSDNNAMLLAGYETVMVATRLSADATGSSVVLVDDTTGFDLGSICYVYDELIGVELTGLILGVSPSDGAVQLSFDVSSTYTRDGLARLYRML